MVPGARVGWIIWERGGGSFWRARLEGRGVAQCRDAVNCVLDVRRRVRNDDRLGALARLEIEDRL